MNLDHTMLDKSDRRLSQRFLEDGWVIVPATDISALEAIRAETARLAASVIGQAPPADPGAFLDSFGHGLAPEPLNTARLAVIDGFAAAPWLHGAYFKAVRGPIEVLAGNELAMQRRINLSIQLPEDNSSLLPVHSDVWSGDSPFELVAWVPLVDCHGTKSMFIVPRHGESDLLGEIMALPSAEAVFRHIEPHVEWLDVPFGHVVVFTPTLMHGNRVNREATTRWSMNCRFKSVLSPYADKRLGEFFEPITLRAASRVGMAYRMPRHNR